MTMINDYENDEGACEFLKNGERGSIISTPSKNEIVEPITCVDDENDYVEDSSKEATTSRDMTLNGFSSLDEQQQQEQNHQRDAGSSVRVAVRVRPFLAFEHGSDNCMQVLRPPSSTRHKGNYDDDDAVEAEVTATAIRVGGQESGPRFTFDQVFDNNTTQEELFRAAVSPLVDCCLEGYNATILAYGQTGSGKTHTMMGPSPTSTTSTTSTGGVRRGNLKRRSSHQKRRNHRQSLKRRQQQNDESQPDQNVDSTSNLDRNNNTTDNNNQEDNDMDDENDIHNEVEDDGADNDFDDRDESHDIDDYDEDEYDCAGIIPRAFYSLFDKLEERKIKSSQGSSTKPSATTIPSQTPTGTKILLDYQVSIQFLELYGEEIRDLLNGAHHRGDKKLTIRDLGTDEPEVVGATQRAVTTAEEALLCLSHGMLRRVTGATAMNESSSRSHAILSVLVEQQHTHTQNCIVSDSTHDFDGDEPQSTNNNSTNGTDLDHVQVTHSRFNFVDLAGSERQKRTQAAGKRLKEGIDINKGLLVLGNVISALGDPKKRGKTFVPYRDSKLTRLLKGSLGGNHKTLMIACVSPSSNNMEESLNCLRYANRARNIQNNAVVNVDGPSRLIQELQGHVQVLASDLVKLLRQQPSSTASSFIIKTSYPQHVLESMANGSGTSLSNAHLPLLSPSAKLSNHANATITTPDTPVTPAPSVKQRSSISHRNDSPIAVTTAVAMVPSTDATSSTSLKEQEYQKRLLEMEIELSKTQSSLRQARKNHDAAEEELYVMKAQKELAELQLSVILSSDKGTSSYSNVSRGGNGNSLTCLLPQEEYLKKAVLYEKEIGNLKSALIDAQTKIDGMSWALDRSTTIGHDNDERDIQAIEEAEQQLRNDRHQLLKLQEHHQKAFHNQADPDNDDKDDDDQIDEEQMQDEEETMQLTKKYILQTASSDDDESEYLDKEQQLQQTSHATITAMTTTRTPDRKITAPENDGTNTPKLSQVSTSQTSSASQRERKVQADLAELSRSIAAKESLIDQLRQSQEKYASMRDFYEERLRRMEVLLSEKEQEREKLLLELKQSKEGGHHAGSKEIEERIGQKEKHIADLRKRQQELMKLTAVSSRNDIEINRLHDEVQSMKRLKVDLQRKIADERKVHAKQLKELQKCALLKDKELTNAKRILSKRELEATRATQVAKQRLDELAQLRLKYKDSEKRLRMASLKRGVLAKAGIDPVIVGRRENTALTPGSDHTTLKRQGNTASHTTRGTSGFEGSKTANGVINVDNLRSYFDQKVAGVVRKEAIVDKLAREWEEHFELSNRKQELLEQRNISGESEELEEAQQALMVQIQFKEERIRKLASRLRKPEDSPEDKKNNGIILPKSDSFLFDKEFATICKGSKPDRSHVVAARVLFGMIVRERRRVAALARTASSLDERVQAAERAAELSEAALRSYMEEQRHELAALTQNQQEHILSLMDMVKEDSYKLNPDPTSSDNQVDSYDSKGPSEEIFQRKLLVLANERVSLLENQLAELQMSATENQSYREKLEEMRDALTAKLQEYEDVYQDLLELKAALRQIHEILKSVSSGGMSDDYPNNLRSLILDIVRRALLPSDIDDISNHASRAASDNNGISSSHTPLRGSRSSTKRVKSNHRHLDELLGDSDAEESVSGDAAPDWANDIMADLALIAEGKLPPSMENEPAFLEGVSQFEKSQRLHSTIQRMRSDGSNANTSQPDKQHPSRSNSKNLQENEQVSATPSEQSNQMANRCTKTTSVFDRLSDPKQFTGTQKQVRKKSKEVQSNIRSVSGKLSPNTNNAQRRREERKAMSKEISNRLDKIVVPTPITTARSTDNHDNDGGIENNNNKQGYQSVFDRLMSPSQYTGTQKEKFIETRQIRERTADQVADRVLDGLLQPKEPVHYSKAAAAAAALALSSTIVDSPTLSNSNEQHHSNTNTLTSHSFRNAAYTEYARKDVFERLQKTTTQAFAVKTHHHAFMSDHHTLHHTSDDGHHQNRWYYANNVVDGTPPTSSTTNAVSFSSSSLTDPSSGKAVIVASNTAGGVSSSNSAGVSNTISPSSAADSELSGNTTTEKHLHSAYIRQDVFERLQKTTTEAYAKKTNSRLNHHHDP